MSRQSSAMAVGVVMLLVALVSQCCSSPQRRNWTPQAILYLKGTHGRRSVGELNAREEERDAARSATQNQDRGRPVLSLASVFHLEQLQRDVGEDNL
ncbi:spexin prohormone 1-like [Aulostomus maculatus]